MNSLRQMLERDEGRRYVAYPDPLTGGAPWTIGVGHTGPEVYQGLIWTDSQVDAQLDSDIAHAVNGCVQSLPWFQELSEPRQAVLLSMAFQMGIRGLMNFHQTLQACEENRFNDAAAQMLDSTWAHQTPGRAARLSQQMATGLWT